MSATPAPRPDPVVSSPIFSVTVMYFGENRVTQTVESWDDGDTCGSGPIDELHEYGCCLQRCVCGVKGELTGRMVLAHAIWSGEGVDHSEWCAEAEWDALVEAAKKFLNKAYDG